MRRRVAKAVFILDMCWLDMISVFLTCVVLRRYKEERCGYDDVLGQMRRPVVIGALILYDRGQRRASTPHGCHHGISRAAMRNARRKASLSQPDQLSV
jgi:hypothetical protein